MSTAKIRVWDPFVRLFHWSLVTCFFVAYLSGEEESMVHIYSGYAVIGLVLARLVWGFIGSKYARFSQFLYSPGRLTRYLKDFAAGRPEHYNGHNPAAAWMIFTLLICLVLTSISGLKVYGIEGHGPLASLPADQPAESTVFGLVRHAQASRGHDSEDEHENEEEEMWEEIHEIVANLTLLLVIVHVAGAIAASRVHRENLVKAMITGTKDARPDARDE